MCNIWTISYGPYDMVLKTSSKKYFIVSQIPNNRLEKEIAKLFRFDRKN